MIYNFDLSTREIHGSTLRNNMIRLINLAVFFSLGWATLLTAAGTIDYFDITKPKFQPLKVTLQMQPANDLNGLYVQSVFQSNIEQTLFFNVFTV